MRKGYYSEYLAKKKLIEEYGKQNVLKIAIGGSFDYLILKPNENKIEKIVEVKEYHSKKKYFKEREKKQISSIIKLAREHKINVELWKKKPFKDFEIELLKSKN